jgi:hypothetical protein
MEECSRHVLLFASPSQEVGESVQHVTDTCCLKQSTPVFLLVRKQEIFDQQC